MMTREHRGPALLSLAALLLLPLLHAPVFARIDDDFGPLFLSAGQIEHAQRILVAENDLKGGRFTPGEMDQATIDAIRAFQRTHTIPATGLLDHETMAQLTSHESAPQVASLHRAGEGGAPPAASAAPAEGKAAAAPHAREERGATRTMPATAGPVPWMTALGAVLLALGLMIARRRRA
jgi:LPXTG-motif cell wall-anchored protein